MLNILIKESKGPVVGDKEPVDTVSRFDLGGCDLGYPAYDAGKDKMAYFFGDSFAYNDFQARAKDHGLHWRSQVMGEAPLGSGRLIFSDFYGADGHAAELIKSHHADKVEMTKIPTGAIYANGSLYFYYFSIGSWDYPSGERMNYGGLAKFDKGKNRFIRIPEIAFLNLPSPHEANIEALMNEDEGLRPAYHLDARKHSNPRFTEVYPYKEDGYIYLFGQGAYRASPLFLARVLEKDIERFEAIEYYSEQEGKAGFRRGVDNADRLVPIIEEPFGEFSLVKVKGTYLLFATGLSDDIVMYQAKSLLGPYGNKEEILKKGDGLIGDCRPYAPLTAPELYDPKTEALTLLVSRWLPSYAPIQIVLYLEEKK